MSQTSELSSLTPRARDLQLVGEEPLAASDDLSTTAVSLATGGGRGQVAEDLDVELDPELLGDLDEDDLVISLGYVGVERRGRSLRARVRRSTWRQRVALLSALLLVVLGALCLITVTTFAVGPGDDTRSGAPVETRPSGDMHARATGHSRSTPVVTGAGALPHHGGTSTVPNVAPAAAVPTTVSAPTAPTVMEGAVTPDQLGAAALALISYPWQNIPGYSIVFHPISDAPEPGFLGNTTFTWGKTGGVSDLYVYPGETVQRLAGITAFEIGHEVDAAAVYPQGGHTQIEDLLGIHPASWAPDCDCAEQGFLSGWYSAAFSARWSPGVGSWSSLAPLPSGAQAAALEPWLNPEIVG